MASLRRQITIWPLIFNNGSNLYIWISFKFILRGCTRRTDKSMLSKHQGDYYLSQSIFVNAPQKVAKFDKNWILPGSNFWLKYEKSTSKQILLSENNITQHHDEAWTKAAGLIQLDNKLTITWLAGYELNTTCLPSSKKSINRIE